MDIDERLKGVQAEIDAAAAKKDIDEMRRLVERAGLTWIDPELPEKYKYDIRR